MEKKYIELDSEKVKAAINEVAASEAGKVLFAHLKEHCRWDYTYLSSEDPNITQYYAAIRGVYNHMRSFIDDKYLKEIEFNYRKKAVTNGKIKKD